ncbi:MAG: hypothetical protein ACI88L_000113 [Candidatus Paceibacteria bacterium]|jgi:hypothetical protein
MIPTDGYLLDEFTEHIQRYKEVKGFLVSRKRILHWLKKFKNVGVYERNYTFKDAWLHNLDLFHDMSVNRAHLEKYKKRFAKYEYHHPQFGFIKVYKHIKLFDFEGEIVLVISLPKEEKLPKGLL